MTYYSQEGQDRYLDEYVFKQIENGFFVDVGAHDGIMFNNTLFFEKNRNWIGINIEPIEDVYKKLTLNRPKCINFQCAVTNQNGKANFIKNEGYTEMLSGLEETYDKRHIQRLNRELQTYSGTSEVIKVDTMKLSTIFDICGITKIDYLSIDTEGAEFEVIKSIDFDKVYIDVIGFENNYQDSSQKIVQYLENKNYKIIKSTIDIFMINKSSKFN